MLRIPNKNILSILIFSLLFAGIVSANGLSIEPSSISINKTQNEEKVIQLNITNEEPKDFSNVTFEENPYLTMESIPNIPSGSTVQANVTIDGTSDFNGDIELKGFFFQDIGKNFETHNLNVTFNEGLSECKKDIIEGDSIVFLNNVSDNIKLINSDTNTEVTTITEDGTYKIDFPNPQEFNYHFERIGLRFTDFCSINAQSSQGFVTDSSLNANLNLDLKINFPPTDIKVTAPITNYTINADGSIQDLLNIKNTGDGVAKIILNGDWFSFSESSFDLNPGDSRNIGYTISPQISETNQTNKTYTKTISVSGNFNTTSKDFNIFVPFKSIIEDSDIQSLEERIREKFKDVQAYCEEDSNRNKDICVSFEEARDRFFNGNESSGKGNTEELTRAFIEYIDEQKRNQNAQKLIEKNQSDNIQTNKLIINQTNSNVEDILDSLDSIRNQMILRDLVYLGIPVIIILVYLGLRERNKKLVSKSEDFY